MPRTFWDFIEAEAALIKSDGCSVVPEFYHECCLVHDLEYWYARCATDAYTHYLKGTTNYWHLAKKLTQAQADKHLRSCIQKKSTLGKWSPLSWWRYWALREFGQKAWNSHSRTHEV